MKSSEQSYIYGTPYSKLGPPNSLDTVMAKFRRGNFFSDWAAVYMRRGCHTIIRLLEIPNFRVVMSIPRPTSLAVHILDGYSIQVPVAKNIESRLRQE